MGDQSRKKQGPGPKRYPYKGQMLTVAQLAEISGWSDSTIYERINSGLSAEQAVKRLPKKPPPPNPDSLVIAYRGEERTLAEWAKVDWVKLRQITKAKLYARLFHDPVWTKEEAFGDAPRIRPSTKKITIDTPDGPVTRTRSEWAKDRGIPLSTISVRISRGWTDAQALEFEPGPQEAREADQAEVKGANSENKT